MPRQAHHVDIDTFDLEGSDALRDDGDGFKRSAQARHLDGVAVAYAAQLRQFLADLAEDLGFGFDEPRATAGHEAGLPVLRDAIGRADEGVARIAHRLLLAFDLERHGVVQLLREGTV